MAVALLVLLAVPPVNLYQLVDGQHKQVHNNVVEKSPVDKLNVEPNYKHLEKLSDNVTAIDDEEVEPKESIECRLCEYYIKSKAI